MMKRAESQCTNHTKPQIYAFFSEGDPLCPPLKHTPLCIKIPSTHLFQFQFVAPLPRRGRAMPGPYNTHRQTPNLLLAQKTGRVSPSGFFHLISLFFSFCFKHLIMTFQIIQCSTNCSNNKSRESALLTPNCIFHSAYNITGKSNSLVHCRGCGWNFEFAHSHNLAMHLFCFII